MRELIACDRTSLSCSSSVAKRNGFCVRRRDKPEREVKRVGAPVDMNCGSFGSAASQREASARARRYVREGTAMRRTPRWKPCLHRQVRRFDRNNTAGFYEPSVSAGESVEGRVALTVLQNAEEKAKCRCYGLRSR